MKYIKQKDRYNDRYLYGHKNALEYLGLRNTVSNIMMLRRSKIGVHRKGKYFYSVRLLDMLFRKIVVETLKEIDREGSTSQ